MVDKGKLYSMLHHGIDGKMQPNFQNDCYEADPDHEMTNPSYNMTQNNYYTKMEEPLPDSQVFFKAKKLNI